MKQNVDMVERLSIEYARRNLDELDVMEAAIKLARVVKSDMKVNDVPEKDIILLNAACALSNQKKRITVPIEIVLQTERSGPDAASIYTDIIEPAWLAAWDCEVYDDVTWNWPEGILDQINANEAELKAYTEAAEKAIRDFETKHDMSASTFL